MVLNLSGRIQVIDYPYALPSKCVVCGGGAETEREFVDFGMQVDPYGAIYFCTLCIAEVAAAVGFIDAKTYKDSQIELFNMVQENTTLEAENREFRRVYSTLSGLGALIPTVSADATSGTVFSEAKPEPESKPVSKPRSKESKANGPSSVEESGHIPPVDGDKSGDDDLSF